MREVVDSIAAFAVRVLGMLCRGDGGDGTEPHKIVGATMMLVEVSQREYADKEAKVRDCKLPLPCRFLSMSAQHKLCISQGASSLTMSAQHKLRIFLT
jgi:hypothetical protein